MEIKEILKNIESNLKKYLKNEKHILEAFNVIAFTKKKKNIDNLVQYITATSILLLIYILGFTVSSIFNCILAVNTSVNPYSIFNLIVLSLNVLFFSVITGPINFSYILMIYNDFFKTLQSDLSNLFFFLNNPSKKISFLLSSIFFSFLTHFILLISIFTLGVIFSFIKIKFIIPVMYLIVFFLFINLIAFNITAFFVFIKKVETFINSILEYENLQYNYLGENEQQKTLKELEISKLPPIIQDTLITSLKIFFKVYFKLIFTTFLSLVGIIILGFGIVITLSLGIPSIAVLLRKYI